MRNSLIFKLIGAFLLVIGIGTVVLSVLTLNATSSAFALYTTRSGQVWGQRMAPALAGYYAVTGSWAGVDSSLLEGLADETAAPGMMGMMGQGKGYGGGRPAAGGGMLGMMGQRLILADANGVVVTDTQDELSGQQLPPTALANGTPIILNGKPVGTIIVTPSEPANASSLAGQFLSSVRQAIISSAAIAAIIALLLGTGLFLQITAPLRRLKMAAAAIARGDLSQRVEIRSKDEFGQLGEAFNAMAASLAAAEAQRRHLVADVAHELRTPLAAIQGTLEGMQDGVLPLDEEQVAALHAQSQLLNRLVGDLKLISLAEAGQLKLERRPTLPGELIRRVVEGAQPLAGQKNIRLEAQPGADLPEVFIDPDRIAQVLNNLIDNALRYTQEGGRVSVQAATAPGGTALEVTVSDTGPGISPEDLPYIFDRFYRADKSRARASGGSGLGLAIVKQLVEAHGGQVRAASPALRDEHGRGYGASFTFTIPAGRDDLR